MNIKDIAAIAHVGVSTVSRVLNNHPDVNDETRKRVLQIIKENNYIPNNSARILKQSNTKNIGILVKGVFNPFFSEILKLVSLGIQEAGYTMILQHHNNQNDVGTLLGFIKEKRLQGVICLGGNFVDLRDEDLEETDVPIVLVSVESAMKKNLKKCSSISINNRKAAFMATEYLINSGHRNIGLILGEKRDYGISKERFEGYIEALTHYGIKINEDYIVYGEYECTDAYRQAKKLLKESPEVTAIFAISDIMAMGVAKAGFDMGRKVGEDISIIGFDGMDTAKYYQPSITTVKQPKNKMSELSVEILIKLLEGKTENKHIFLEVELVQGQSCTNLNRDGSGR
ncbi:MAG: LacI family transcriptional regulator [Cellulosilyticum sp.]|nr:LacI family transcriptional regulator [Cellulosilyticum sp.]